MFGTLGGPELFLILIVALIVFGPRKLPEIGKSVGRMMGEFRRASNEFRHTIESEVEAEKIREATRIEMPRLDDGASKSPYAPPAAAPEPSPTEPAAAPAESSAPAPSAAPDPYSPAPGAEPASVAVDGDAPPAPIEPK